MPDESIFFRSGNVTVTNARFIVGAQTFAMRGITSVQGIQKSANRSWPIVLLLVGLIFAVGLFNGSLIFGIFGLLVIAGAIWIMIIQKPSFAVVLRTAGGEITAYESKNREHMTQIIQALNNAIVSHG
jgi:hypothetical protein